MQSIRATRCGLLTFLYAASPLMHGLAKGYGSTPALTTTASTNILETNDPTPLLVDDISPPKGFIPRDQDWFTPGQVLEIFCPSEPDIHLKEFVLLDTRNVSGPGLRVRHHTSEQCEHLKGSFHRNHVLLCASVEPEARAKPTREDRRKIVYLDDYENELVPENTWIELEHVHSISFGKHACADRGKLEPDSLVDLRQLHVNRLIHTWRLKWPAHEWQSLRSLEAS